jgi:hypothetical protein
LRGLSENRQVKFFLANKPPAYKTTHDLSMLALPFFEDFSTTEVLPDPQKWEDYDVFVNSSFAVDPVSVGVATLDAIDQYGEVYALTNQPTSSDKLTSLPFDLAPFSAGTDTVRISFFYQAGGKGEVPEIKDSLLLEFYSPAEDSWKRAWYAITDTATPFEQVILAIPKIYYQSGFRFRFRNYTSLSPDDVSGGKGALSNVDCWNIDYIMMNTNPVSGHISITDITLVDPPRFLMDFYESIPWLHLNNAQSITRKNMRYVIRNLEYGDSANIGRSYYLRNLQTGLTDYYEQYFAKFGPYSLSRRNDPFFAPFTRLDDSDEGMLEAGAYLITPADQFKSNDTAKTILFFKDYYAYDDGTPEYGFGISGESTMGALLAYRFRIFQEDTLQAVDMLFNKSRDNFNANLKFKLCVWKDEGGIPGDLIYISDEDFSPEYGEGPPGFARYPINPSGEKLLISDTTVYIGWKQLTDEFLNLGYDVNRNNLDRTFVNISGNWFNPGSSLIPGSLMMRAVFGSKKLITAITDHPSFVDKPLMYPNPVVDWLHVKMPEDMDVERIIVYDVYGRPVLSDVLHDQSADLSRLEKGFYLVHLIGKNGSVVVSNKIVVSH